MTDEEVNAGVSVLKDVNFVMEGNRLCLGPEYGPLLEAQLQADVDWLKRNQVWVL